MNTALVLIDFIGCPRNMLLKLRIEDYLKANGWAILSPSKLKSCDLIVFCSCGYITPIQKRSFHIISTVNKRISKFKKPPMFIVTGCVPNINRKALLLVHDGPAFGPRQLDHFDRVINATTRIANIPCRNKVMTTERVPVAIKSSMCVAILKKFFEIAKDVNTTTISIHHRIFKRYLPSEPQNDFPFDYYQMGDETICVTTSIGCQGNCSYCAIRFAKGRLKSRPPGDIIEEAIQGVKLGHKWISLIADDNGSYGRDIGTNFVTLLRELCNIEGDFNILIDSLNPNHFIEMFDELRDVFNTGKIKSICLTIQHVNSRILSSMNRSYDVDKLKQCLSNPSTTLPAFIVDAHFIVGYPGETEEEFEELVSFAKWFLNQNSMNSWNAFPFSSNQGTLAAKLDKQISKEIIRKRLKKISRVRLQYDYNQYMEHINEVPRPLLSKIMYKGLRRLESIGSILEKILIKLGERKI